MDIQSHKKTLGIVHIVYGCMIAAVFIFIGAIISAVLPFLSDAVIEQKGTDEAIVFEMVANLVRIVAILIFIFSALPSIIAGIALVLKKDWGLILALIAGCISIFNFPIGTGVGIYSIYVFFENNKQKNDQNKE